VFSIRIGLHADPDKGFYLAAGLDPGSWILESGSRAFFAVNENIMKI